MTVYNWYELSWKEQRTVVRLARQGSRHPDPNVARVADEWAREKLGLDRGSGGSIAQMLVGVLLAEGSSVGEAIREYRAAKRIIRVSPHARDE